MWEIVGYIAAALTIAGFTIGAVRLFLRRRRRKTELRGVQLPNRDALVRAVHEVASTANTLLVWTRELNQMKKETPFLINTEVTQAQEEANAEYVAARAKLAQENLVAGYAFREPIGDFIVCVMEQLDTRAELKPQDMSGRIDINLKAEDTVRRIDAIVSGQENL